MKQWITLVAIAATLASCTKENLSQETEASLNTTSASTARTAPPMRMMQQGAYLTDWEQYGSWDRTDEGQFSTFGILRKTPEVTDAVVSGGVVLTYTKYASSGTAYASFANPTMMPFYYQPEAERPLAGTNHFSDASGNGDISISYSVPFTKQNLPTMGGGASLPAMKFQHVVMDKTFLLANGLDPQTVRNNYTYEQVMQLLNER